MCHYMGPLQTCIARGHGWLLLPETQTEPFEFITCARVAEPLIYIL